MGRQAGWIALCAGIAGGADMVLLPEFPMSLDEICKIIKTTPGGRQEISRSSAVAEGFKLQGSQEILQAKELDAFGHVRLGGIGEPCAKRSKKPRALKAAASCSATSNAAARPPPMTACSAPATESRQWNWPSPGEFGKMVALRGTEIVGIDLDTVITEAIDKKTGKPKLRLRNRCVSKELYDVARVFFG